MSNNYYAPYNKETRKSRIFVFVFAHFSIMRTAACYGLDYLIPAHRWNPLHLNSIVL